MQGNLGIQIQMCRVISIADANGEPKKEKANIP